MAEASVSSKVANRAGVENCPPSTVVRNGAGVTRVDSPALTDLIETTRTTRHVQGPRTQAPPRRPDEPIVHADKEVRAVQRRVGAFTDGMWGDGTSAAVQERIMKFQGENGLPVTGRYDRQTAERMRGNPGTKDLATALNVLREMDVLDRVYRVAPWHTVTETQERRVPAPDNTDEASVGGVCAVPSIAGDAITPAATAQPSTATGNGSAVTPNASTVQNLPAEVGVVESANGATAARDLPKTPQAGEGGRVLDAADSLWLPRGSTSKGRAGSPPQAQPDWMGAAAELGATLRGAGGNIQNVAAQNEPNHGVTADASVHAPSFGMMA